MFLQMPVDTGWLLVIMIDNMDMDTWMGGWMERWRYGEMGRWRDGEMDIYIYIYIIIYICTHA
jgi:hypothetical protein